MLRLYNTLSRSIEDFVPLNPRAVTMYSCGPTVYDNQHIGHMRRYVGDDILVRLLKANGFDVNHVMNITDVGHLVSDSDEGEDKMEKGARKHGMTVWEIAQKFEKQFFDSTTALGIPKPSKVMHATEYIPEQIALIQKLEEKGYTYKTSDGIYFDSTKFENYFKLSRQNPEELQAGKRVEMVEGKKNPSDFALWKFSPRGDKRSMEWESPWAMPDGRQGVGFPGWHIECSAMSMKELGETLDIHTGGVDHINIHHTNEIAQSEAATGKQFVRFWVHHNFLMVDGQKMSKSLGNLFTMEDLKQRGYDPLSLRYLFLGTHYRQEMNFTFESLDGAEIAMKKLRNEVSSLKIDTLEDGNLDSEFYKKFLDSLNEDMNTAKALAVVWELIKSDTDRQTKLSTLKKIDEILGLDLFTTKHEIIIPEEVQKLVTEREEKRRLKDFKGADELRNKIKELGFDLKDQPDGSTLVENL